MNQIAVASNEQATGIEQINTTINHVANVAASGEDLTNQAEILREMVWNFKLT